MRTRVRELIEAAEDRANSPYRGFGNEPEEPLAKGEQRCRTCGLPKPVADFPLLVRQGRRVHDVDCAGCRQMRVACRNHCVTLAEYRELRRRADGRCRVCGMATGKLVIDHDRANGRLRELVCFRCNTLMALLDGDPALEPAVTAYRARWRSEHSSTMPTRRDVRRLARKKPEEGKPATAPAKKAGPRATSPRHFGGGLF